MDKLAKYTICYEYFANNYKLFNYDNYKKLTIDLDFYFIIYTQILILQIYNKKNKD